MSELVRDEMMDVKEAVISPKFEDILKHVKNELCEGSVNVEGDAVYYTSPLLDFSNDEIIIKIVPESGVIKISDNGSVKS